MKSNILKSKTLSLGFIALSAISVATIATEIKNQEDRFADIRAKFESPQKPSLIVSQAKDDVKSASLVATRNIALHLSEEAKVRAEKEIEIAKKEAQIEIEEIKKGVEKMRFDADLEIKKIREGVELEKTKAFQELEDLKRQKYALEQELNAAKNDALITKSGVGYVASFLNPWSYTKETTPPQINSTEANPIDQSNIKEGTQ